MTMHEQVAAGWFVTTEAAGAYKNGTRVRKTKKRDGDAHDVGATAKVIGSLDVGGLGLRARFFYFVVWDDFPGVAVGVAGDVLEALS